MSRFYSKTYHIRCNYRNERTRHNVFLFVDPLCTSTSYLIIVIPWVVRLYVEIIHEHKRVDYLTYRWANMV